MLTVEIKVNGIVISLIKLVNTGVKVKDKMVYGLEAYVPSEEYEPGKLVTSSVSHKRDDGALILVEKAIRQVVKKRWLRDKNEQ